MVTFVSPKYFPPKQPQIPAFRRYHPEPEPRIVKILARKARPSLATRPVNLLTRKERTPMDDSTLDPLQQQLASYPPNVHMEGGSSPQGSSPSPRPVWNPFESKWSQQAPLFPASHKWEPHPTLPGVSIRNRDETETRPRSWHDVKIGQYPPMKEISHEWSTEDARKIQDAYHTMEAIERVMGGQNPVQATLQFPEVHAALQNGELPSQELAKMLGVAQEIQERKIDRQTGFAKLAKFGQDRTDHLVGQSTVDFKAQETRAARFAAMDAAEAQVRTWTQQIADKATTMGGVKVTYDQAQAIVGKLSDQQHAFVTSPAQTVSAIAGPGAGKSTSIVSRVIDQHQQGIDVSKFKYLAPSNASAEALVAKVQAASPLMPGFDTNKIKPQTFWSMAMSMLHKPTNAHNGRLVSPLALLANEEGKKGAYADYQPMGGAISKEKANNLEEVEKSLSGGEIDYLKKLLTMYHVSESKASTLSQSFSTTKYNRSLNDSYTERFNRGAKAYEKEKKSGQITSADALFYVYEQSAHLRGGFRAPGQTTPVFDRADTLYMTRRAANQGLIEKQPGFVADEIQGSPAEAVAMLAALTSPASHVTVGGDMSQKDVWDAHPTDEYYRKAFSRKGRSFQQVEFSGNFRSDPLNVAAANASLSSAELDGLPKSPFMTSVRDKGEWGTMPQFRYADTYHELYQGEIARWFAQMQLSMKQVHQNMQQGLHPLTGAAMSPQQAPFIVSIEQQRKLVAQILQGYLTQHLGPTEGTQAYNQIYTSETPSPASANRLHVLKMSQVKGREFDNPIVNVNRVGKWDPAEYQFQKFTEITRARGQQHFIAAGQNLGGGSTEYDQSPDIWNGRELPHGSVPFIQRMIDNAIHQQGLPIEAIPDEFQSMATHPFVSEIQEALPQNNDVLQKMAQFVQMAIEHNFWQPKLGEMPYIEAIGSEEKEYTDEGGDTKQVNHGKTYDLTAAGVAGDIEHKADPERVRHAKGIMRLIGEGGPQALDALWMKNIPDIPMLLSAKDSPFGPFEKTIALPSLVGMDRSQYVPGGVPRYDQSNDMIDPEQLVNSTIIANAGTTESDDGSEIRPLGDVHSTFDEKNRKFERSVSSEVTPDFFRDPKKQRAFDLRHRAMTSLLQDPAIARQFTGNPPGIRQRVWNSALKRLVLSPRVIQQMPAMPFSYPLKHKWLGTIPISDQQITPMSLYTPTAATIKGGQKMYKGRGSISASSIQQFLQETDMKKIQKGMNVLLRHPGFKQQVEDRMKELDERPGGNLPLNDEEKAQKNLFNLVQMDKFGQHPAGQELLRQQYDHPRIQRFVNSRLQKSGGAVPEIAYRGLMDKAEALRAQGDLKGAASLEAQAKHILGGKASFYDKQVAALVANAPTPEFGEHIQAEAQQQLVQKALRNPDLLRSVLGVTHDLIDTHALSYPEYLATRSSLFNMRAYKDINADHNDDPHEQVTLRDHHRADLLLHDPQQLLQLETILKGKQGNRVIESDAIKSLVSERAHTPALARRFVGKRGMDYGITQAMSRTAPFMTEMQAYAHRLEQTGIVDPMAGVMKNGEFQPLGAAVPLGNYQKRLEEILGQQRVYDKNDHAGFYQMQQHHTQVKALRGLLNDPSMQEQMGHFLNIASRVSTTQGATDKEGSLAPLKAFFGPQQNQFGSGQRSLEGVMGYMSALTQAMEHTQRTGTIKRGHLDQLLGAMGHDTNAKLFAGLRHFEKKGKFTGPEDTLSLDELIHEFPGNGSNLAQEFTRYPIHPNEPVVFTGTPMGPQQQGTEPGTPGTLQGAPMLSYNELQRIMQKGEYDYDDYGQKEFGFASNFGDLSHPFYGLLTEEQKKAVKDAAWKQGVKKNFEMPMEPMYLMQQVGAQGFTTHMPVLASQVMPEHIYNRLQGGESFGSLHPSSRVVEADSGSGGIPDVPSFPEEAKVLPSLEEALAPMIRTQQKKQRKKKQYTPLTSLEDLSLLTTPPPTTEHAPTRDVFNGMRLPDASSLLTDNASDLAYQVRRRKKGTYPTVSIGPDGTLISSLSPDTLPTRSVTAQLTRRSALPDFARHWETADAMRAGYARLGNLQAIEKPAILPALAQQQAQRQDMIRLLNLGRQTRSVPSTSQNTALTPEMKAQLLSSLTSRKDVMIPRSARALQRASSPASDAAPLLIPEYASSRAIPNNRRDRAAFMQGGTRLLSGLSPIALPQELHPPLTSYPSYDEKRSIRRLRQEQRQWKRQQAGYTQSYDTVRARRQYREDQYARIRQNRAPTSPPLSSYPSEEPPLLAVPEGEHALRWGKSGGISANHLTEQGRDQFHTEMNAIQARLKAQQQTYRDAPSQHLPRVVPSSSTVPEEPEWLKEQQHQIAPEAFKTPSSFTMPQGDALRLLAHQASVQIQSMADYGPIAKTPPSPIGSVLPSTSTSSIYEDPNTPPSTQDVMKDIHRWNREGNLARRIYPPSDEQLGVLNDSAHHKIIEGGPGGGKTATVDRAIMDLIASGEVKPHQVKLISAMHSGAQALNEGFDPYRDLMPRGHEYQFNDAQTFHSLANEIVTPSVLRELGLEDLADKDILEEPNEDERDQVSPQVWQDKLNNAPSTRYMEFMQHRGVRLSREEALRHLGDINRVKNQRGTPDSTYDAMMLQGRATLIDPHGPMTDEAKLALYEQGIHEEGSMDYADLPYYAYRALNELGPRVLSPKMLKTRVFGLDEAQDTTTLNGAMFQKVLSHMQDVGLDPRVFVGMDRMQSLMQGNGGIDKEQVRETFQHMLGVQKVHQLTKNFRSDAGTVALNNATLQHPDLVGTAMSPQQVPISTDIGKPVDFSGLAQSEPTMYRNMFRSMIDESGISLENVQSNLAQGQDALEGMSWPENGPHTIPSQAPAILFSRNQQRLFGKVAQQEIQAAGFSPRDAKRAYQQMFRNRLPGRFTSPIDAKRAKTQFPVIRVGASRSLQFKHPHFNVSRIQGWASKPKDINQKRDYLSSLFTGISRTAKGGQLHVYAASHPFRADQQDYYEQHPESLDDSIPGIVRLAGGPQGGRVLASPLNEFESYNGIAVPAEFSGIMQRQQTQIDDWQGNGLLPSQVVNSTLASPPPTLTSEEQGPFPTAPLMHALMNAPTLPTAHPSSTPPSSPISPNEMDWSLFGKSFDAQGKIKKEALGPGPHSSAAPPPRVTNPSTNGTGPVTINTPNVQVNLPNSGSVTVNRGNTPSASSPGGATPSPVTSVPAGTGATVGNTPLFTGQAIGPMNGRSRPGSMGMTPYSANAGMATQVGGGQPPSGGGPSGSAFAKFNNTESQMGHSLSRIGGELQYLGQLGGSIIDATIKQGSDYRKATIPLGSSVSGTNGTQNFFDFSSPSGGINTYSHNTLPMYSNTRVAQGIQDLTGMTNTSFSQGGTLPALTDIMGLSAMTGISSQALMGQMTGIQGTLGGNVLGGIPNMTGMLSGLYGSNLTEGNVSPTLSALQSALPTVQGLQAGGSGGMAQVMAFYKLALQSGMTSNNLGGVSDVLGSLSGMGNNPNLQQQYMLGQMFGMQNLTGATDLAQFQSQQTNEMQSLAVNRLQQNIGGGLSLPNLQIKISQATIKMDQAQLTMSAAQLQASTVQQQQSQLQQNYNVASFAEQQSIANAQYGPIGMDSSKTAYFSWLRSKNAAQYNGTSPEIATQFQSAPTFGLQNAQFYAGLEHQRSQMVLSRSPLLSDMAFQENNKYINQQEAFYQAQLKLTNQQRAFELDWQPKLLAGNQKVLDVQKSMLGLQAQELGIQQNQFVLQQAMATYEQKNDAITQQYLKQQGDDLANLVLQQQQKLIGLGPINGKNVQPDQIVQALANQHVSDSTLRQQINQMGLPLDQQQTLMVLVKQLRNGGKLSDVEKQLSGKGDKALQANLQKLIQSGAFSDAQTQAATANAALNYGGTGAQWTALITTLGITNKSMEVLATTFAPSSSFVLAIEKIANVLGPLMTAVASIFNIIGLLKAVGGGGNLISTIGKGIGAASGTTLGGLALGAAGVGATIWGGVQGWGDFGKGTSIGGILKNVLLPGYNFGNDAHRTLQEFQNIPAIKAKNDKQWQQLGVTIGQWWVEKGTPFFQKTLPGMVGGMGKWWNDHVVVFFTRTIPSWWTNTEWPYLQKTIGTTFSQLGTLFHDQIPALFNNILNWFSGTAGPWWHTHIDGFFNTIGTSTVGFFTHTLPDFFTKTLPKQLESVVTAFIKKEFGGGTSGSNPLSAFFNLLNSGGGGSAGPSVVSHGGFITPNVNQDFGHINSSGERHQGVDFNASQGTPLSAFNAGVVTGASFQPWGGEVDMDIGNGLIERYLHLSLLGVVPGQKVKRGQRIALTGGGTVASGLGQYSTGAHLHAQIDPGNMLAGINPWPIWAMTGDMNLSQFFGGASGELSTSNLPATSPVTSRQLLHTGGARLSSAQRMHHLSEGGIAMTRMRTELAEQGPEAVLPLSKLASVLNTSTSGSAAPASTPHKMVTIAKIAERLELHVHTTAQTLDETAQDNLMAQLLDIFTKAIHDVNGKLT